MALDGKLGRPAGSVDDWLVVDCPPDSDEFAAFLDSLDAILMGRATYDAIRRSGDWPYPGKPTIVIKHRPLVDAPPLVETRAGDLAVIAAEVEARAAGRVWIEGGGVLLRGMIEIGRLDVLELAVIPIVLGDGIPLFPGGTPEVRLALRSARPWIKGAVHLIYDVARPPIGQSNELFPDASYKRRRGSRAPGARPDGAAPAATDLARAWTGRRRGANTSATGRRRRRRLIRPFRMRDV